MVTDRQKYLLKKYNDAPSITKEWVMSDEFDVAIQKISEKYNLSTEQAHELADEVELIMFEIVPLKYFLGGLQDRLEIDKPVAIKINEDVTKNIFSHTSRPLNELITNAGESSTIKKSPTPIPVSPNNLPGIERADVALNTDAPSIPKAPIPPKPFGSQQSTPTTPRSLESLSQNSITPAQKDLASKELSQKTFEEKLKNIVHSPQEKSNMSTESTGEPLKSAPVVDPYKEPIE